ncbi:MAG: Serine/threonine protein phosphatase [Thermocaproicibacter melissae]|uniref:serine/threonine protein phosphatase n=1 Tax=Thermocaproicibacter melissae TaxID=2966552 RepID=UPI0024B0B4B9|nr:serine/threonine protein phosphatase [Thermocaproicibacter melissae]WBY63845.1 serine/threonine protein phosphatase [Thermocaproicibacter melissae]
MFPKKRKRPKSGSVPVTAVQTAAREQPFSCLESWVPVSSAERRLYGALRESVPIIDAAIGKILRLVGSFRVRCPSAAAEEALNEFLQNVPVGSAGAGVQTFLDGYLSDLLTYGNAVGEMVVHGGRFAALYNASLEDVELQAVTPLELRVFRRENGTAVPVKYPQLVLCSALNPPSGSAAGVSILRGLPFVSNILLQIYQTIGLNWERLGNVRFAVTYRPTSDAADQAYAKERAEQIAGEWARAMRGGEVSDFVSVGDVSIKAIGSDCQIPDCSVPIRALLEQIVAKLGIPPFLLGLTWSSTERMSSQQADILTSELEAYRRVLNPVIGKICSLWLTLSGFPNRFTVEWDDITLQDAVELASARYQNAKAEQIESAFSARH